MPAQLLPYLGSFIDERRIDMELGSLATAALRWLVRCMSRGEEHAQRIRRDAPTLMEVAAVMVRSLALWRARAEPEAARTRWQAESAVLLRVHFTDGRFVGVAVEPWMTFKCVRRCALRCCLVDMRWCCCCGCLAGTCGWWYSTRLAQRLALPLASLRRALLAVRAALRCRRHACALLNSSPTELNPMVDSDLVMDQVSFWQRVHREEAGKSASAVAGSFYFLYRPMYYFDVADEDRAAVRLMFMQVRRLSLRLRLRPRSKR